MYVSASGFNANSTGYLKIYLSGSQVYSLTIPNTSASLNNKVTLSKNKTYTMFLSAPNKGANYYSFYGSICYG